MEYILELEASCLESLVSEYSNWELLSFEGMVFQKVEGLHSMAAMKQTPIPLQLSSQKLDYA